MELYKTYRPKSLANVIGQSGAVLSLQKMIESERIPHAVLLSGPSGVGKTTIGRILAQHLKCGRSDYVEINCADMKGIDMIRSISRQSGMRPIAGDVRVWMLDEFQKTTSDAQNSFLKVLEDSPEHAYFFLATTDGSKLLKTIHTRCTEIRLAPMTPKALGELTDRVVKLEGIDLDGEAREEMIEAAEGSARKLLVILDQISGLPKAQQFDAVSRASASKDEAILLARALVKPGVKWQEVTPILKNLTDDPESIRYMMLGYARSILLKGGPLAPRAYMIIDCFGRNFYDSKLAGLAAACWEVVHAK